MRSVKALIITITLICVTLMFALSILIIVNNEKGSSILFSDIMIIFALFFVTMIIFNQFIIRKQVKTAHTVQPVTRIACQNCKYSEKRAFQTGDYIFKHQGLCLKCGGKMIIEAIYLPSQVENKT